MGQFMQTAGWTVRALTFDAHTSHSYVKKLLFGDVEDIPLRDLRNIPWFRELQYKDLPEHDLPRLPVRIALHRSEVIWALPGTCFLENVLAICGYVVMVSCKLLCQCYVNRFWFLYVLIHVFLAFHTRIFLHSWGKLG